MGAYIIEDAEAGQAVYRFAHAAIAEHFAANSSGDSATDPAIAFRIAIALVNEFKQTGSPAGAHVDRYLWRYVARAGNRGLELLRGDPCWEPGGTKFSGWSRYRWCALVVSRLARLATCRPPGMRPDPLRRALSLAWKWAPPCRQQSSRSVSTR